MKVVFADAAGAEQIAETSEAMSLKDLAKANNIQGIVAECGGMCACGTCHVYIQPAWLERLAPPAAFEAELLDAVHRKQPNSRLACQIMLNESLDGLCVRTPPSQY